MNVYEIKANLFSNVLTIGNVLSSGYIHFASLFCAKIVCCCLVWERKYLGEQT